MAEQEVKSEPTSKRVVGVLSALYFTQGEDELTGQTVRRVLTAHHGEEVDLPASEVRRLERNGALLPEGSSTEDALRGHEAKLDAYRSQRGDVEALQRHEQRLAAAEPDIVDVDEGGAGAEDQSVSELAARISEEKLNADDTVALAGDDPAKAAKVLEAERTATGGSPRANVEQRLQKLIDG